MSYAPGNCSWMNRIECQFTALRKFTLNGTDHATRREQGSMIRRYMAWRNRNTSDPRLHRIIKRANERSLTSALGNRRAGRRFGRVPAALRQPARSFGQDLLMAIFLVGSRLLRLRAA